MAAERAGFEALWISDHFHPWNNEQGNSPFVWSVIGAISQACDLPVTTAVTCPMIRTHPAIIAQAAATCAQMLDGKFILGVGSGEALNEHILGTVWPSADVRLEMLEEAVDLIRQLWTGEVVTTEGKHYRVDHARIYNLPETPPEIYVSGFGPKATDLAARIGDGYINTAPDDTLLKVSRTPPAASRPRPAPRSPTPRPRRRAGSTPTGCGPTPACPASSRRCCRPRSTSSRPPSW